MENMLVWVNFEVEYHPPSTGHIPRLTGSLKELGVWRYKQSIRARQTKVDFLWRVSMKIPTKSYFFFKWIVKNKDGQFMVEKTGCRKAVIGKCGGTFFTIYSDAQFTFISNGECKVELTTNYILNFTEEIGLVGSGDSLGNWQEKNVLRAVKYAPDYWVVNLELAHFFLLEYKWVIVDKNSKRIIRWQEGENRKIRIGNGWRLLKLNSPWSGDVEVMVLDKTLNTSIDAFVTTDCVVKIVPPAWKSSVVVFPVRVVSPNDNMVRVTSPGTSRAEVVPPFIQDRISIKRKPGVLNKISVRLFLNFKRLGDRKMWFNCFILMNRIYNQWRFNQ